MAFILLAPAFIDGLIIGGTIIGGAIVAIGVTIKIVRLHKKLGLKEGRHSVNYDNGDQYEGNFQNYKREGRGIFRFKDQRKYDGEFKNNQMTG
jgi:hypothetical protein